LRRVYLDSAAPIATLIERDALHARAVELISELRQDTEFVTTDAVFAEVLAWVAEFGAVVRGEAVGLVQDLMADPGIQVVRQDASLFDRALRLYGSRSDKGYSLTDCMSMLVCRDMNIRDVVTSDHHFEQERFRILL